MNDYMVLIQPWGVYVKERSFFIQQGGLRDPWGKNWRRVRASSLEAARNKGKKMVRMKDGKRIRCTRTEWAY
jgi:hypothetical protein